ncbi:MAG: aspartyl/asparaginyl beta-hydroxylase domain-containing protein [Flavipsychrobacter sp.]
MNDTVIKYIKLPFHFDTAPMLAEINNVKETWLPHYNSQGYTGEWTALPLRTIGGTTDQHTAEAMGSNSGFEDTALLAHCPEVQQCIDTLQCEKLGIRVLNLRPEATIKEHRDFDLCYEEGEIRIHIPLQTNDQVSFLLEGEQMTINEGECWYMNFDLPHTLSNNGKTDRLHLVIDCVVNEWITNLFSSTTLEKIAHTENRNKMSRTDKQAMLEQLKQMNNEASRALIAQLEKELQTP